MLTIAHTGGLVHSLGAHLGQQMMHQNCRLEKIYIEGECGEDE